MTALTKQTGPFAQQNHPLDKLETNKHNSDYQLSNYWICLWNNLLHYCISELLHHCIIDLLYYCIAVLPYYCIIVLLYYCIIDVSAGTWRRWVTF